MPKFRHVSSLIALLALCLPASLESARASNASGIAISSLSGTYLAGRSAGINRDMDAAADLFGRALDIDPKNPLLIERTFLFSLSSGNFARAEQLAGQVIAFAPEHRLARTVLGLKEFRAKRYAKAREDFRKAEYTPVGELAVNLFVAWSHAAEKNAKLAYGALDALDSNEAFEGFKAFHGALIADFLGDKEKARQFFTESLTLSGRSMRVIEAYGSFLERDGKRDAARTLYQDYLKQSQSPVITDALARLDAGIAAEPFIADAGVGLAEALFSLASALTDDQSMELSLIYAQMAVGLKPDFVVARTLLGDIHSDLGQHELAIADFEAVPVTSPLKPAAEVQIALSLHELKREDEALARLAKLLEQNPRHYEALTTKGNMLRAAERYKEAGEAYAAAIALVPQPQARHWSLFYSRAITFERQKMWPQAEADFRKALALEPDQPLVLNYLGYSFVERAENLDEAMQLIRKAVELKPNDGYIVDSLGWAHYQLGEYEEAVKHLERAVELKPADPVINDHLGDAYWRVGRRLEARFQWQHAKDNEPEPDLLTTIEAKLKDGLADKPATAPAVAKETEKSAN